MTPYISIDEIIKEQGNESRTHRFLSEKNGCINGCCSGTTIYADYEFNAYPGCHDDQEGFYVLEGEGYVKLDDEVFPIKIGDSFVAMPGVKHTLKTKEGCQPVKVFWFHSAV